MKKIEDMNKNELKAKKDILEEKLKTTSGEKRQAAIAKKIDIINSKLLEPTETTPEETTQEETTQEETTQEETTQEETTQEETKEECECCSEEPKKKTFFERLLGRK